MCAELPSFRWTPDDVEELRDQTRDQAIIDAYSSWVKRLPDVDELIRQISQEFAGVQIEGGIGLLEADALDNYASEAECAELRQRDERSDWRNIDTESLNRYYVAPSYFDARGFVFHLPAFLIAEFKDQYGYGFIDRLIDDHGLPPGWRELLTASQRQVLVAAYRLIGDHPDYVAQSAKIETAIHLLETLPDATKN